MDTVAIANASDELLKEMGLSKAGDRLSSKGFCAHQEDESSSQEGNKNRKRALLEAFLSRKKEKNKANLRALLLQSKSHQVKKRKRSIPWMETFQGKGASLCTCASGQRRRKSSGRNGINQL